MRILITGAAGFIGRHLTRALVENGHYVAKFDKNWGEDLRREGALESFIEAHRPDTCIHLAAKVGRVFGENEVIRTVEDNAGLTAKVAQTCGERYIRLVYASTSEVYGDEAGMVSTEDNLEQLPHNMYGLSKRWGEEACRMYARDRLLIWRISMPYGPGLPAGRGRAAIINFLDWARRRRPISVHRGSERSWCFIDDTVSAMLLTLETGGGVYNIGRDDDHRSMQEVAEIACELTGAPKDLIREVPITARTTPVKRLSSEKIRALGWVPNVPLREGMRRTLEAM